MSWLTEAKQQLLQTESQDTFVQNPNEEGQAPVVPETEGLGPEPEPESITPVEPESVAVPAVPQKSWLMEAKNQMEASVDRETLGEKGKKWLSDISDTALNQINDHNSVLWQGPEGVNEAMSSLAWTAFTFNASLAAGAGRMAYEKLRNLVVPEEQQIGPKGVLRKTQRDAAWIAGLVPSPKTDVGKAIVKPVGEFFHKLMKGPIKIGKDMTEFYGPNIGWLSEQALTLGLLKFIHARGNELTKGVKEVIKKTKPSGKKSARRAKLEAELDSLIEDKVDSKATQRIIDQYEELVQSEYIVELENFQREKFRNRNQGPAIMPKDIQKPGKIPKAPPVELPEAGKRILEFAQTASQMQKKASVKYPEVVSKKRPAKIDLAKIKKDSARRVRTKAPEPKSEPKPAPKPEVKVEVKSVAKESIVEKSLMDTLKEKKPITEAAGKIEKQNLKEQVVKGVLSGEYKGAVRFTTASELKNAIIKGKFTPSKEYDAIHAQPIIEGLTKEDVSFAAYGDYTKHNVAILFPEKVVKTKPDAHTSEVLIDPKAKLEDARFFIGNQKKSFTYPELIAEMGKKPEVKAEVKIEPKDGKITKAYHGTSSKFIEGIKKYGLKPISMEKIVENVLDDLKVKGAERDNLRQTIYDYDYFEDSVKGAKGHRPFKDKELYVAKDLKDAKKYAEFAGEAYDNALIATGAFNKPGGLNRPVSDLIAKKSKKLLDENEKARPIVLEVEYPGELKKGDNIALQELKYKIIEEAVKPESIKWRAQGKEFTSAAKADVEAAKDMGVYAEIKEQLGKGKTSADIMTALKKGEYYAQDLKDLKYTSRDMIEAIRAIDIIEHNNPKAIQRLKKSLKEEYTIIEKRSEEQIPADIKRVNPETGRKSGVEAPDREVDLGTDDAVAAYRHRQAPIKLDTGKIAKSRFMAEKSAEEQGLIGELVKDPNSEGWLVRASKKQREAASKRLQSEWDKFLKEEPESTPAKESYWNERGEIDLDIFTGPITETMKLLKRVARRLEKDKYIRNFNHNEKHLIEDLLYLHTDGKIDMDVTYGLGNIEKKIGISPKHKLDKYPQTEDTIKADITDRKSIPFKDKTIKSILYDPHYLIQPLNKKTKGKMVNRFGASPNVKHLWQMFDLATSNIYSLLKPGGKLIIKIQDATNAKTIQSVNEMYNFAVTAGFRPTDKFYYQPRTYMPLSASALGKQKVGRKIVTEYQVYERPKRSYKHPAASVLSKDYKKPTVLEEGIPNSILKNERGELAIDLEGIIKIRDFIKSRKVSMRDARDLLIGKGLSQDQINKILIKSSSVQKTNIVVPDKESQWLKPGQNPNELLPARSLKNGRKAPAVNRRDARIIEQTPDIGKPIFGEKVRHLATSDGIFTEIGKPIRELFYRKVVQGEKRSSDIGKELIKESNSLKKSLPLKGRYKSLQRIDNYAISKQPNGKARLEAQGVEIVKNLNAKEMGVYNRLQAIYKDLYIKINRTRKANGLETFPPVENYSVWIHDMNKLKQMENISNYASIDAFRKGMERVSKLPTKRDVKGRTVGFRGHEKFRGGPEVPGHLRLNAIDNFNSYALIASDILGKSEPIAYLHELLQPKFELYKNSNNTYNFLNEWLDYQKGIEPIMFITNPKTRRFMSKLSGNVAVSFISYAPKSAVVQFSSLNNSIAELGFPRMLRGIARLTSPEEIRRASRESNILTTRTPESILMDAADSNPLFPGAVGRALHVGRKKVRNVGTVPLSLTDSIVSYSTWLEGEAKGKKIFKKSTEYRSMNSADGAKALKKFARNYADDMVVRAQGSAAKSARSPAQRTAEGKFITTLQTFTIANFDYLTRHVLGIKNPDITKSQQVARVMNWVMASTIISKGFNSAGWSSPIPQPIKAYQEKLEQTGEKVDAIKEAAKELLEFLPVYGGKARYGSELAGVVTDQLVKLGKGDLTAIPRLMGIEGFSTMLKGYRAYKKDGTAADIMMGRYIKKPKKSSGGIRGIGRVGGI